MKKRDVEVVVVSDLHLGTYGCHAEEILKYLKSIRPQILILNGDIVDIWQFRKRYWPKSHMKVVKYVMGLIAKGVQVYYVTGNHDEMMRKFVGFELGNFKIVNKIVLEIDGSKAWIFHGDVFDVTMQHSKWLAQLGAVGYDILIFINAFVNFCSKLIGRGKISLSKRIKEKVKSAVKFINKFEQTAAEIAIENHYDYVVCGHIHQPDLRQITTDKGKTLYLNSGDWVENLTALEYHNTQWRIYRYSDDHHTHKIPLDDADEMLNNAELFENLLVEFDLKSKR
jgi:UDP-2,3-diacylglucosamine pyrophosphatase LpxH